MQNLKDRVQLPFKYPALSDKEVAACVKGEAVQSVEDVFLQMHLSRPLRQIKGHTAQ